MAKFYVGNMVKVLSASVDRDKEGKILKVVKVDTNSTYLEDCEAPWYNPTDALELITSMSHIRSVIISVPTEEDWKVVVRQAIKDGCDGCDDMRNYWSSYGENSCIRINENGYTSYAEEKWYDDNLGGCERLTTQQYLNKFKQSFGEQNKPKGKIMGVIKKLFKSTEDKALDHYEITRGCKDNLTSTGREEFIDYLWNTMIAERKAFIAKVVEQYKEDIKK